MEMFIMPFATSSLSAAGSLPSTCLELALRGVRVVPVFQRRLLRQHDANPYGSATATTATSAANTCLDMPRILPVVLGGRRQLCWKWDAKRLKPGIGSVVDRCRIRSRAETIALRDIAGSVVAARLALSGIWFGIIYWKALRARRVLLAHTYCTPYSTVPLS